MTSRSANATIRGYWWQLVVAGLRWLNLKEPSYIVCEGSEDIDIITPTTPPAYTLICEQLKDYTTSKISAGNKIGREIIANFASIYFEKTQKGIQPSFRLVTTTSRASQNGDIDVIETWELRSKGDTPSILFLTGIRDVVKAAIDDLNKNTKTPKLIRAQQVANALNWLNSDPTNSRWVQFLDSVEWRFKQDSLETSYSQLIETLEQLVHPNLSKLVADRLLVEIAMTVSMGSQADQKLTQERLHNILESSKDELEQWRNDNPLTEFLTTLFEAATNETKQTKEKLSEISKKIDTGNELLLNLVKAGVVEGSAVGIKSPTPTWDEIKQHTRAVLKSYPKISINNSVPIQRQEVQDLTTDILTSEGGQIYVIDGEGGSGKSTSICTCIENALEDSSVVVLALNIDQISPQTPLDSIIPNTKSTPDRLIQQALIETNRRTGILILDQIDRLSQVSASSQSKSDYLDSILHLIARSAACPNISVLFACRTFDSSADSRIGNILLQDNCSVTTLKPLNKEDIQRVVSELGYSKDLTPNQVNIYSTPLHLHLLASIRNRYPYNLPPNTHQIYEAFWKSKRRALKNTLNTKWNELHRKIHNTFITQGRRYITDRDIEDEIDDIEKLVSENVMRTTENGFVYFHQRYEEYVFARYFEGNLADHIRDEGESLEATDQIKAILIDHRSKAPKNTTYVEELKSIIFGEFKTYYKMIVRGILSSQPVIMHEEFKVWTMMINSSDDFIKNEALKSFLKNPAFLDCFDLYFPIEHVYLNTDVGANKFNEFALSKIRPGLLQHMIQYQPEKGARWVATLSKSETNHSWLSKSIQSHLVFQNRSLFDSYLTAIKNRVWDLDQDFGNGHIYDLPKHNIEWVPEVVKACMELRLSYIDKTTDIKTLGYSELEAHKNTVFKTLVDHHLFPNLASEVSCYVVANFAPLIPSLIDLYSDEDNYCHIWRSTSPWRNHDNYDSWLNSLLYSLEQCPGPRDPSWLPSLDSSVEETSPVPLMIRLRMLATGDYSQVEEAKQCLMKTARTTGLTRLPDKYRTYFNLLTRAESCSKQDDYIQYWHSLIQTIPEDADLAYRHRHALLSLCLAFPDKAKTKQTSGLVDSLLLEYGDSDTSLDPTRPIGGIVDPIDHTDLQTLSNTAIVSYMRDFVPASTGLLHDPSTLRTIQHDATEWPVYYVNLLEKHFSDIPHRFRIAIIDGWNGRIQSNPRDTSTDEAESEGLAFFNIKWNRVISLLERVYRDDPTGAARSASHLLYHYQGIPPKEVIDHVVDSLLHHSDPAPSRDEEDDESNTTDTQKVWRLESKAINCVRGRMAELYGTWILKSEDLFLNSANIIQTVCKDPAIAVRVNAAYILSATLSYDRHFAIQCFSSLIQDQADILLATTNVTNFIKYALHTHINKVSSTIDQMIESNESEVRTAGGILYGISTFIDQSRLRNVHELSQNTAVAIGFARIWKSNIQFLSDGQTKELGHLLNHSDDTVLKELSGLFGSTDLLWFVHNTHLFDMYFESRAMLAGLRELFWAFQDWDLALEDPVLALDIVESIITKLSLVGSTPPSISNDHNICEVLQNVYTSHPVHRSATLEILDRMILMNSWTAEVTLNRLRAITT